MKMLPCSLPLSTFLRMRRTGMPSWMLPTCSASEGFHREKEAEAVVEGTKCHACKRPGVGHGELKCPTAQSIIAGGL